jgi:hypothetical protein
MQETCLITSKISSIVSKSCIRAKIQNLTTVPVLRRMNASDDINQSKEDWFGKKIVFKLGDTAEYVGAQNPNLRGRYLLEKHGTKVQFVVGKSSYSKRRFWTVRNLGWLFFFFFESAFNAKDQGRLSDSLPKNFSRWEDISF